jgi:transposase
VEASSGEVVRHRLSLAGNRKLNYALHMGSHLPSQIGRSGRELLPQEDSGGQILDKEALRCLKRRISDAVFRSLMADSCASSRSAA